MFQLYFKMYLRREIAVESTFEAQNEADKNSEGGFATTLSTHIDILILAALPFSHRSPQNQKEPGLSQARTPKTM